MKTVEMAGTPPRQAMEKWNAQKVAFPRSHGTRFHIFLRFKKGGPEVELRSPSRVIVRLENAMCCSAFKVPGLPAAAP